MCNEMSDAVIYYFLSKFTRRYLNCHARSRFRWRAERSGKKQNSQAGRAAYLHKSPRWKANPPQPPTPALQPSQRHAESPPLRQTQNLRPAHGTCISARPAGRCHVSAPPSDAFHRAPGFQAALPHGSVAQGVGERGVWGIARTSAVRRGRNFSAEARRCSRGGPVRRWIPTEWGV